MELSAGMKWGGGGGGKRIQRESGLHQLYILANTIVCMKSSIDRFGMRSHDNGKTVKLTEKVVNEDESEALAEVIIEEDKQLEDEDEDDALEGVLLDGNLSYGQNSLFSTTNTTLTPQDSFRFAKFKSHELTFIAKFAQMNEWCLPILLHNFCPIIFGQELVKMGLLLALFGGTNLAIQSAGVQKTTSHWRVRSNIHVLVVGDPGLGKVNINRLSCLFICLF